jgi:hypothetical protein
MDITIQLPSHAEPSTIREIIKVLEKEKLEVVHDHKNWGDWIRIIGSETVISIDVNYGLSSSATIECESEDPDEFLFAIYRAFHRLKWIGIDEEGEFQLV